jgi:hypothetical protein
MTLEAIALADVRARGQDLKVRLDVESGDVPASQRHNMVDMPATTSAVASCALSVNRLDRDRVSPSWRSVDLRRPSFRARNSPFNMVLGAEKRRLGVVAVCRIPNVFDPGAGVPTMKRVSERLHALAATFHAFSDRPRLQAVATTDRTRLQSPISGVIPMPKKAGRKVGE